MAYGGCPGSTYNPNRKSNYCRECGEFAEELWHHRRTCSIFQEKPKKFLGLF